MTKLKIRADSPLVQRYNKVFSLFAAFYYLIFLYCIIEHRYFGSVYQTALFRIVIVLLVVSYFIIYRFQGGIELHLLALYCLWVIITQIVHGEVLRRLEFLSELQMMLVWFIPGIILHGRKRDQYCSWLSWITIIFFALLGLVCIYVAVTRSVVLNPLNGDEIRYSDSAGWGVQRILFLSLHPNGTGGLYLIAFSLSLVMIFKAKSSFGKAAAILSAGIAFLVVAMTASRNAQTFASAAFGLMAGIFVLSRIGAGRKMTVRAAVLLGVTIAVLMGSYRLYEPIRKGLWKTHVQMAGASDSAVAPTYHSTFSAGLELRTLSFRTTDDYEDEEYTEDPRGYLESGRKKIWWSAIKSLQLDPTRLLCGAPMDDVMDISNNLIREQAMDFHNCFLQVVNEFGLPALLLVLTFFFKVFCDAVILTVQDSPNIRMQDRMLALPVVAMMGFNMLETKSFIASDFTALFFFFACGLLVGVYREIKDVA
ncbi:MAG: hypothetical protein IJH70_05505 [Oscillospiraceae bacterium]|nr:hypothetical protein [Oscillospiraceae bacterium]